MVLSCLLKMLKRATFWMCQEFIMVRKKSPTISFFICFFIMIDLAASVHAGIIKRDENGFEVRKDCDDAELIREGYLGKEKAELLSRGQSAEWDMELHVNKETSYWILLGKSRAPDATPGEVCVLSSGIKVFPYQKQKWYQLYFKGSATAKD